MRRIKKNYKHHLFVFVGVVLLFNIKKDIKKTKKHLDLMEAKNAQQDTEKKNI